MPMSERTGPDRPTDAQLAQAICDRWAAATGFAYYSSFTSVGVDCVALVRAAALAGTPTHDDAPTDYELAEELDKKLEAIYFAAYRANRFTPDDENDAHAEGLLAIYNAGRALAGGAPTIQYRDIDPATVADELAAKIPDMERTLAALEEAGKVSQADLRYEVGGAPAENLKLHTGEAREALRAVDGPPLPADSTNYAALYYPLLFLTETVEATLRTAVAAHDLPPDTDYDRGFTEGVETVTRIESARLLAEGTVRPWYAFSALGDPPVGAPAAPAPEPSAEALKAAQRGWNEPRTENNPKYRMLAALKAAYAVDFGVAPGRAPAPEPATKCHGPDCPMCSGDACDLCGAGCWNNNLTVPCEHDVIDRHNEPFERSGGAPPAAPEPDIRNHVEVAVEQAAGALEGLSKSQQRDALALIEQWVAQDRRAAFTVSGAARPAESPPASEELEAARARVFSLMTCDRCGDQDAPPHLSEIVAVAALEAAVRAPPSEAPRAATSAECAHIAFQADENGRHCTVCGQAWEQCFGVVPPSEAPRGTEEKQNG